MNVGLHQDACLGVFSMWCFPAEEEGTMLLYYCKRLEGVLSRISALGSISIEMGGGSGRRVYYSGGGGMRIAVLYYCLGHSAKPGL